MAANKVALKAPSLAKLMVVVLDITKGDTKDVVTVIQMAAEMVNALVLLKVVK